MVPVSLLNDLRRRLCEDLDARVVAEGIETDDELEMLEDELVIER